MTSLFATDPKCLLVSKPETRAVLVVVVIVGVNFKLGQHIWWSLRGPVTCPQPASAFCPDTFYLFIFVSIAACFTRVQMGLLQMLF